MKAKKMREMPAMPITLHKNKFGHWAFLLGIVIAIIAALAPIEHIAIVTWILLILGTLVGFLNITREETNSFLIATTSLIVLSLAKFSLVQLTPKELGLFLANSIGNITLLVVPAALIVTLKAIWALAED